MVMAELSEAEAAVYDRQLRVWGVEVQKRLRNARVLIIGCGGLAAEVAKNIVLAGVGRLELMDATPSRSAADTNFLNCPVHPTDSVAQVMSRSLSEMNPLVSIVARDSTGDAPSEDLVEGYNLVLIVGKPLGSLVAWDSICRKKGIAFLAAVSRGTQAFFFQDAGDHSYQPPDREGKVQAVQKASHGSLEDALKFDWSRQKRLHPLIPVLLVSAKHEQEHSAFPSTNETQTLLALGQQAQDSRTQLSEEMLSAFVGSSEEFAPVNSIVGGVLANEVLKCISKKGEPLNNVFCYSMLDGGGAVESLVLST